ncbi:MAG: hypothetical protein SFY81_08645 [Verrucomicrobiota bacterium]|nr:hypothetical protein [Verrucomicrobiota bacterium]
MAPFKIRKLPLYLFLLRNLFILIFLLLGRPASTAEDLVTTNNSFATAIELTGAEFELQAGFATNHVAYDEERWWKWHSPSNSTYRWTATNFDYGFVNIFEVTDSGGSNLVAASYQRSPTTLLIDPPKSDPLGIVHFLEGRTYAIRLKPTGWYSVASFPVSVNFKPLGADAPSNDHYSAAKEISGTNHLLDYDLSSATFESLSEPKIVPQVVGQTLWWKWQSPGFGTAILRSMDSNAPALAGIYVTTSSNSQKLIATSATQLGNECVIFESAKQQVRWDTIPGVIYQIQIDRFPAMTNLLGSMEFQFMAAPVNDAPEGAIELSGFEVKTSADNRASTHRPAEPLLGVDWSALQAEPLWMQHHRTLILPDNSEANSIWFKWRSPNIGIVQVTPLEPIRYDDPSYENHEGHNGQDTGSDMCGKLFDLYPEPVFEPVYALFKSDANDLPMMEPVSAATQHVHFPMTEPGLFYIQMDSDPRATGVAPLNLLHTPPPTNDLFQHRILLPSTPLKVIGRTYAATSDPSDPEIMRNTNGSTRTVWWEWESPDDGEWYLKFVKRDNGETIHVFSPDLSTNIGLVSFDSLLFSAAKGQRFCIGVSAPSGNGGNISFTLSPLVSPTLKYNGFRYDWNYTRYNQLAVQESSDGWPIVVEQSTNLIDWISVTTNYSRPPAFEIPASHEPALFFRTRYLRPPSP